MKKSAVFRAGSFVFFSLYFIILILILISVVPSFSSLSSFLTDWWCCRPIYIGPQQQSEPDGTGDGWWPATQPRVTLADIRLSNITSTGGTLPHPGVLRCNASNPCEGFVIDAVRVASRWDNSSRSSRSIGSKRSGSGGDEERFNYVCDYVLGQAGGGSSPAPDGGRNDTCVWS